jgi:thiol-disulfide isomerase/thioredoxin
MKRFCVGAVLVVFAFGCEEKKPDGPAPSRYAAVKKDSTSTNKAASAFCEKQWPIGEGGKKFVEPPEKAIPGAPQASPAKEGGWKWINVWATWCAPCVEEMGLLSKWKSSLTQDGVQLDLELWSVDEEEAKLTDWLKKTSMPGRVRWVRSQEDLPAMLEGLGADKASAIPVHAFVDASGNLRCLRVGSVHDEDYGAIKAFLTGA